MRRRRLRVLAAVTLVLVGVVYYRPARSYFETRDALRSRAAEVQALRRERAWLHRRLAVRRSDAALEREARQLGYVKPGERLFIVKGIAAWRRTHDAGAATARRKQPG